MGNLGNAYNQLAKQTKSPEKEAIQNAENISKSKAWPNKMKVLNTSTCILCWPTWKTQNQL
jgi:hypothetical protein